MNLADLSEALSSQWLGHAQILSDGEMVSVCFTNTDDARRFAGALLSCGLPRRFVNNKVDARVSFLREHLGRVLELLEWLR